MYEAEVQRFKAIVRHIAKHELEPHQSGWFQMESRGKLRRLAGLGIYGHQPGIAAHVATNPEEEERVVEAILRQKVGSCSNTMRQYKEHTAHRNVDADAKIRVRIARIATRTIVRWGRPRRSQEEEEEQDHQGTLGRRPAYDSRVLQCSRCGTPQETKWMQLRMDNGYRAIHCKQCKKQERGRANEVPVQPYLAPVRSPQNRPLDALLKERQKRCQKRPQSETRKSRRHPWIQ